MIGRRIPRPTTAGLVALATAALLGSSCIFDTGLSVTFVEGTVFISTNTFTEICDQEDGGGYSCTFFDSKGPISDILIDSLEDYLELLILIDPMVVQFPDDVGSFAGSFLHVDSGTGGSLDITAGLASIPVDDSRTLVAEPGTQLVTIELPPGAPTSGNFAFNINFAVPPGTTEVVTKPIFTGRIETTDGGVFQAPLYPCRTDMAQVPPFVIPVPAPGDTVDVPRPDQALACDGEVYEYFGNVPVGLQAFGVD